MTPIGSAQLLSVWEAGVRRHPIDRALLLFALASPDRNPDELADAPLGERNAAIMALREACFGGQLSAWVDCQHCGERMEFELQSSMLPPRPTNSVEEIIVDGLRFTAPTSRHLALASGYSDADCAAMSLIQQCILDENEIVFLPTMPASKLDEIMAQVGEAIDKADPWAELSLDLSCPACGQNFSASFDIGDFFWDELDSHARQLLDDIHSLASVYGWSESDILSLGDTRRAVYLDRVRS